MRYAGLPSISSISSGISSGSSLGNVSDEALQEQRLQQHTGQRGLLPFTTFVGILRSHSQSEQQAAKGSPP